MPVQTARAVTVGLTRTRGKSTAKPRRMLAREREHRQVVEALAFIPPSSTAARDRSIEARISESEGEIERMRVREALAYAIRTAEGKLNG